MPGARRGRASAKVPVGSWVRYSMRRTARRRAVRLMEYRTHDPTGTLALARPRRAPGMPGAKATRRPRFHTQGEDDANHTASDGSRPARAGGLRPCYQRAHGAEPGREPHWAAHVPCATDPPTEDRERRL